MAAGLKNCPWDIKRINKLRRKMKSLVVYSSQTDNTEKLAKAIFEELKGEKKMSSMDEAPPADGYDLVAVGFWFQ
ncbi:MAG: flavodoxin family protein, partial [Pseudomonadota bacterium]